jgi:outer membrane protein assembly factor BamB
MKRMYFVGFALFFVVACNKQVEKLLNEKGVMSTPVVVGDKVFFSHGSKAVGFDLKAKKIIWAKDIHSHISNTDKACAGKSLAFFRTNECNVVALSQENGEERWRVNIKGCPTAPLVCYRNTVYVGTGMVSTGGSHLIALEAKSGKELWRAHVKGTVSNLNSLAAQGDFVYAGSVDHHLYAFDTSGSLRWTFQSIGQIHSNIEISQGLVMFMSNDGTFYVLDEKDGKPKWKTKGYEGLCPTVVNDLVILPKQHRSHLYALDLISGKVKWSYEGEEGSLSLCNGVHNDKLMTIDFLNRLVTLDVNSGKEIASVRLKAEEVSSLHPIQRLGDKLLFVCDDTLCLTGLE